MDRTLIDLIAEIPCSAFPDAIVREVETGAIVTVSPRRANAVAAYLRRRDFQASPSDAHVVVEFDDE